MPALCTDLAASTRLSICLLAGQPQFTVKSSRCVHACMQITVGEAAESAPPAMTCCQQRSGFCNKMAASVSWITLQSQL